MRHFFRITVQFMIGLIIGSVIGIFIATNLYIKHEKPYKEGYNAGLKQGRIECVELIKSTKP